MLDFLKEKKPIISIGIIIIAAVGILFLVSKFHRTPEKPIDVVAKENPEGECSAKAVVTGEVDIRNAFIKVAETVGQTVVSISTERVQKFKTNPLPFRREGSPFRNEFFDEFFKDFFRGFPEEYERKQTGLGSGVIIDREGYILTNEHVVSGANKITVTLSDGRKFEGMVKGSDVKSDLAVIKIDATDLPVAVLGNSDFVQTGEWVVAIGNPFGYLVDSPEPTVTAGVVSALHRSLPSRKSGYLDLIQTDAAINPGNSGGPLCDLNGHVIGINVAIFSTTGGYQGVGFAIPVNKAKSIIDDLIQGKKIEYGWMGVVVQDVTEDLAKYFGLPDMKGILVAEVIEGGPADMSGIRPGDVIIEFDGKRITNVKDLLVVINGMPIGKKVRIVAIRDKAKVSFSVSVGTMPSEEELARMQGKETPPSAEDTPESWRGMEVYPITRNLAARFNIADKEGVAIVNVEPNSPAYYAQLRPGDVIKRIDKSAINTIDDYREAIKGSKGDVLIYTNRGFTIVKEAK